MLCFNFSVSSVQLLSCVWLSAPPWTAACQASLYITSSWSLLKLMSINLVMPFFCGWVCVHKSIDFSVIMASHSLQFLPSSCWNSPLECHLTSSEPHGSLASSQYLWHATAYVSKHNSFYPCFYLIISESTTTFDYNHHILYCLVFSSLAGLNIMRAGNQPSFYFRFRHNSIFIFFK